MENGVNISPTEWRDWATYFAELFPTAEPGWIEKMTNRMVKTLSFCGIAKPMSLTSYERRLEILRDTLKEMEE
jgi:dsRNA-specific ribonuclease